jgi:hypothetical protein
MGLVLQPDPRLLGLTFNRCSKLLGLVLQSGPLKLGSVKFNIIINIKNFIIYVINIIIFIIINIFNIEKKNYRFDLKGKIQNYHHHHHHH